MAAVLADMHRDACKDSSVLLATGTTSSSTHEVSHAMLFTVYQGNPANDIQRQLLQENCTHGQAWGAPHSCKHDQPAVVGCYPVCATKLRAFARLGQCCHITLSHEPSFARARPSTPRTQHTTASSFKWTTNRTQQTTHRNSAMCARQGLKMHSLQMTLQPLVPQAPCPRHAPPPPAPRVHIQACQSAIVDDSKHCNIRQTPHGQHAQQWQPLCTASVLYTVAHKACCSTCACKPNSNKSTTLSKTLTSSWLCHHKGSLAQKALGTASTPSMQAWHFAIQQPP